MLLLFGKNLQSLTYILFLPMDAAIAKLFMDAAVIGRLQCVGL